MSKNIIIIHLFFQAVCLQITNMHSSQIFEHHFCSFFCLFNASYSFNRQQIFFELFPWMFLTLHFSRLQTILLNRESSLDVTCSEKRKKNWNFLYRSWNNRGKRKDMWFRAYYLASQNHWKKFFQWCEFQICPQKLSRPYNKSRIFLPFTQNGLRGRVLEMSWLAIKIKCYLHNSSGGTNLGLQVCILDILISSNHNIHKSSCVLCFWASDPLIDRF